MAKSSATINFSEVAQKLRNPDKDFRFMGLSDLFAALNDRPTLKIDGENEARIMTQIVHILHNDVSGDVKSIAIKCLPVLATRISDAQLSTLADSLTNGLSDKRDEVRDISNMGLKAALNAVTPERLASFLNIARKLCNRLCQYIQTDVGPEVKQEALDVLGDVLKVYGSHLALEHESLLRVLLDALFSSRANIRKRSIPPLSTLAAHLGDTTLTSFMETIVSKLSSNPSNDLRKTLIQLVASSGRSAGPRLSKYLPHLIPLLATSIKTSDDDEVKEQVLQAFESIVLRCSRDVTPFIEAITSIAMENIRYDPNYAQGEDDDDEVLGSDDEDNDDDGDYSDDEDISWKVRRYSAKLIACIASSRSDVLHASYAQIFSVLVSRFQEREESVKIEVYSTFVKLLHIIIVIGKADTVAAAKLSDIVARHGEAITKALVQQLKKSSVKVKAAVFTVLRELLAGVPNSLDLFLGRILPLTVLSVKDRSSNSQLKLEALAFVSSLLSQPNSLVLLPVLGSIFEVCSLTIKDSYYKVSADAIRCVGKASQLLGSAPEAQRAGFVGALQGLFSGVLEKAKSQDADQEVKEAAITTLSFMLVNAQEIFAAQTAVCMGLFFERLKNEVTRIPALKAITVLAQSTLDIAQFVPATVDEVIPFLRKSHRQLRQVTLQGLETLVSYFGGRISMDQYVQLLADLALSLSENDLGITYLSAHLLVTMATNSKETIPLIYDKTIPNIMQLMQSALLQGQALSELLNLLEVFVLANDSKANFVILLANFLSVMTSTPQISKSSLSNLAQCVAVLCASASASKASETVTKLISGVQEPAAPKLAYLLTIGEIGRRMDLSSFSNVYGIVGGFLEDPSDDIRLAASTALGQIAIGNLPAFLPVLISEIQSRPKNQYMLLHSVREVLLQFSVSVEGPKLIEPHTDQILALLNHFFESSEEGTKSVASECLGKMALLQPIRILAYLVQLASSPSPSTRAVVMAAIRYAIVDKLHNADSYLEQSLPAFIPLLNDSALPVQKAAIQTINFILYYKSGLIRPHFGNILPLIYKHTAINKEHIRFVDLGPFKHEIDDGLDIRKAAYTCMSTMLDRTFDMLVLGEFIPLIAAGLRDKPDIQALNHVTIAKLCTIVPSSITASADVFVDNLSAAVQQRPKENAVKQEIERIEEMKRSALRAVDAIVRAAEGDSLPSAFAAFVEKVVKSKDIVGLYEQVRAERDRIGSD